MDVSTALGELLTETTTIGRMSLLALSWTLAASMAHLFTTVYLYVRFSREGPVPPAMLPQLQSKWDRSLIGLRIWKWLRGIGLFLLFATVIYALADLGLHARHLLASGPENANWRLDLAESVEVVTATLAVLTVGFGLRVVIGGLANIIAVRAQNFVTVSNALVSREEVDRMRAFLDRVEAASPELPDTDRQ